LQGHLDDRRTVLRVVSELDAELHQAVESLTAAAVAGGRSHARQMLDVYALPTDAEPADQVQESRERAVTVWLTPWAAQAKRLVRTAQLDETLVFGMGAGGLGWLSPGPVLQEGSRWLGALFGLAMSDLIDAALQPTPTTPTVRRDGFLKQAVAALDERTTECCLLAHGQVQPIGGEFVLTGEPRYADRVDWPPFHWWCRTASALVRVEDANDELTRQMRAAGRAELAGREAVQRRVEIHPADARSRRPHNRRRQR
jgi:hypothetical protein